MQDLTYKIENFEGPLDLLLQLIEKNKMDIYDISINTITDQYMEYIKNMDTLDLDNCSSFLVMASTLLEIKSKMMLPKVEDENEEEIDPREELVQKLLEYKKYKSLGYELQNYEDNAPEYMLKKPTIPKDVATYIPSINYEELLKNVDINRLNEIFIEVIRRKENSIDKVRANFGEIKREKLPLKDSILRTYEYIKSKKRTNFKTLLESANDIADIVVTFLAILTLVKVGNINISQEKQFGDIYIDLNENTNVNIDLNNLEDE